MSHLLPGKAFSIFRTTALARHGGFDLHHASARWVESDPQAIREPAAHHSIDCANIQIASAEHRLASIPVATGQSQHIGWQVRRKMAACSGRTQDKIRPVLGTKRSETIHHKQYDE